MSARPGPLSGKPGLRLAIGLLVAALLWWALPEVPVDQQLRLRLGAGSQQVSRLRLHLRPRGEQEATQGVQLYYPSSAPPMVVYEMRVAPGEYEVWVTVSGAKLGQDRTSQPSRVTLEGQPVTLHLAALLQ